MTHFGDTPVREVMVPRPDIVTIPAGATVREALDKAVDAGLSHLPALDLTIDEIAGVAHARDRLGALDADRGGGPIRTLLWPAHFVPETKRMAELLAEMQDGHVQIAIVVDEYGGTAGLVSLEELEPLVEPRGDGTVHVSGRIRIAELDDQLGTDLPAGDWDTAAGLLCARLGHIPAAGETATCGNHTLGAEQMRAAA
jgi:putative hemolysin